MNVLLFTLGSHGDVLPFIALARALAARGHACRLATHPWFHSEIAAAGIEPVAAFREFPMERMLHHPDLFHRVRGPLTLGHQLGRVQRELVADARRLIDESRPDVIAGHHGAIGARWVATERSVPYAAIALSPVAWHVADDPVPVYQVAPGRARAAIARVLAPLADAPLRLILGAWIRRIRRQSGVANGPAWPSAWDEFRAGDRALGLWPSAFRPPLTGDPPGSELCGFPWNASPASPLDPELAHFLAAGKPPFVFTLGSAAVRHPGGFFALAIEACRRLGERAVLLTGRGLAPPSGLARDAIAVEWASHASLFPRALANVHHAGIGSTAEALRAGRPSIAIPHAYDQFNNAVRAEKLGAGLALSRHHLTIDRLVRALDQVRLDPELARRAAELAPAMSADGAEAAAHALERLRPRTESRSAAA